MLRPQISLLLGLLLLLSASFQVSAQPSQNSHASFPSLEVDSNEWESFLAEISDIDADQLPGLEVQLASAIDNKKIDISLLISSKLTSIANETFDYKRGSENAEKLLASLPKDEHRGRAITFNNLGTLYRRQTLADKAISAYESSCKEFELLGEEARQAVPLGNLAGVFEENEDYENAIRLNLKTKEYSEALTGLSRQYNLIFDYYRLGMLYGRTEQNELAISHFEKAIEIAREFPDPDLRLTAFVNYIDYLTKSQKFKPASDLIAECKSFVGKSKLLSAQHEFVFTQINFLLGSKRADEAYKLLEGMQEDSLCDCDTCSESFLDVAAEVYLANGMSEKAGEVKTRKIDFLQSKLANKKAGKRTHKSLV